jgi:hypothetical protein
MVAASHERPVSDRLPKRRGRGKGGSSGPPAERVAIEEGRGDADDVFDRAALAGLRPSAPEGSAEFVGVGDQLSWLLTFQRAEPYRPTAGGEDTRGGKPKVDKSVSPPGRKGAAGGPFRHEPNRVSRPNARNAPLVRRDPSDIADGAFGPLGRDLAADLTPKGSSTVSTPTVINLHPSSAHARAQNSPSGCGHVRRVGTCAACQRTQLARWAGQLAAVSRTSVVAAAGGRDATVPLQSAEPCYSR